MNYINQLKLIRAMLDHQNGWLDYKELLSTVDRHQIKKRIEKTNPELIGIDDFFITEDPIAGWEDRTGIQIIFSVK